MLPEVSSNPLADTSSTGQAPGVLSACLPLRCKRYPPGVRCGSLPASHNCTEQLLACHPSSGRAALLNGVQSWAKGMLISLGFYFWNFWADLVPQRLKLLLPFGKLRWKVISHLQEKTIVAQYSTSSTGFHHFVQTPLNHTAHHLKQTLCKGW